MTFTRTKGPAIAAMIVTLSCVGAAGRADPSQPGQVSDVNLARTAEVGVSSEQAGFPKSNAIDGRRSTEWAGVGRHPWIKLQWKEPVKVGRLVVSDRSGSANIAQGGKVLFSDGSTLDVDDIPVGGAPCTTRFEPKKVRWLRLDLFSSRGNNPGLAEIEVYSDPGEIPKPVAVQHPSPGTLVTIDGDDPHITAVDGVRENKWCGAMWCPFAGTGVRLVGATGPASGMADVYIDGIWQKTVDWYRSEPAKNVPVFAAENLPDGKHLLGILTRGVKRAESRGVAIDWSRIEYVAGAHSERFVPVKRTRFDPNVPLWLDDRGEPIQCHMGGIMYYDGKYYMVGGDWRGPRLPGLPFDWAKNRGMVVYSSTDLLNWTCHGNFCGPSSELGHPLYSYAHAAGRGKLIRARGTGKFVALFQVVGAGTFGNVLTCEMNASAVAVADKPEGPYRWHGILKIDGKPVQGSDTAVFTDDDGRQYFITALSGETDWNVSDCLYELAPDCLSAVKVKRLGTGGEAPVMFKRQGVYYFLHSRLTGLQTNDNFYHTATNIWGPWQAKGKIAQGDHSANTFLTQTTDVVPVAGKKDSFIWIGDSIRNNAPPNTRTVWLPVTFEGKDKLQIRWLDSWDPSIFRE
jgi:hypothetical protein